MPSRNLSATLTNLVSVTGNGNVVFSGSPTIDSPIITTNIGLPTGNTAARPATPTAGNLRFNSDVSSFEGYNGTKWGSIGGGLAPTSIKTSSGFVAVANDLVRCNTASGAFSIAFPSSPTDGDIIGIVDIANRFNTYNLTILANTKSIELNSTSYILDVNGAAVSFVYNSSTTNWKLLSITNSLANSAFSQANTATATGQAAFSQANSAFSQANTATTTGQAAYTAANTALTIGQAAYTQSNTAITTGQAAFTQANAAYNTANTKFSANGGTISGSVTITTDLNVTGNVYLSGNVTTLSSNNLSIHDPLIYLAEDNPSNLQDIGIVGSFTGNKYQHTGIVRDATDGVWKLFSNVSAEPTTTIDFSSDVVYDTIKVGAVTASNASFTIATGSAPFTVVSNTLVSNLNVDLLDGQHGAYYTDLSNTALATANAAYNKANTITSGLTSTSIQTSNYTAAVNDLVRCNTAAGAFSVTFPASPTDGALIGILDIAGTFNANNVSLLANGKTIENDSTSLLLDMNGTYVSFVYSSATSNWKLLETPLGGTGLTPTPIITSSYIATVNDIVRCNTAAGAFTVTFPAVPTDGALIAISDIAGSFNTYNLTVVKSGTDKVENDTSVILDVNNAYVTFMYNQLTANWRLLQTPSIPSLTATPIITSSYTAMVNDVIRCNTAGGAFAVTFPADPSDGSKIEIIDVAGTFYTNNLTINRGGFTTIENDTSIVLDMNSAYVSFMYNYSTSNWRLLQTPVGSLGNVIANTTVTGMVKVSGAVLANAVAGVDYMAAVAPGANNNILTSNGTSWVSTTSTAASTGKAIAMSIVFGG
jgi:hypothetical protein